MLTPAFNDNNAPAPKIVIAIDGPAASGKGTLAKVLAKKLGYAYLDTGSLFRTVGVATLKRGGDPAKLEDVLPALDSIADILTAEETSDPALRTREAAEAAAAVATMPEVRKAVRVYQHAFTKNPPGDVPGIVLDGRDVGTVVYPNADMKFFVTATLEERAHRRYEELKNKVPGLTPDTVKEDIRARDDHDMNRMDSPLLPAKDAYVLDNTGMTPPEVLEKALDVFTAKLALQKPAPVHKKAPKL